MMQMRNGRILTSDPGGVDTSTMIICIFQFQHIIRTYLWMQEGLHTQVKLLKNSEDMQGAISIVVSG